MLLDIIKKGSTDRSVTLRIIDSADGTPETGVLYNTTGIDLWYRREGAAKTSVTEATLAALTTAHADGGFLHVGDGVYRFDLPDAAFATSANYVDIGGTVTDMIVIGGRVRLVDVDFEDTVRGGMTALPNAAAEAAGGLYTRGTGAGQINQSANGRTDANAISMSGTTLTARDIGASVLISSGTGSGQLDVTSGAIKIQTVSKKNQALAKFEFVMTDSTTHAPATGKTVSITRSIDGGAFGGGTLGSVTELSNGVYYTDIPAADLNGNVVTLRATASGADDLFVTFTLEP
jgi:hypothetical protein